TMVASPASLGWLFDSVKGWPARSTTCLSAKRAMRILGPCRSAISATKRRWRAAISRTRRARSRWSSAVPCERFKRATSMPARAQPPLRAGRARDAALGPLQVAPQRHEAALARRDLADQACALAVVVGGAVREIQAGHVDAGAHQGLELLGRGTCRAQRGDDLGAAQYGHGYPSRQTTKSLWYAARLSHGYYADT